MRPPDLPGGNTAQYPASAMTRVDRFNEAAGFTRRKRYPTSWTWPPRACRFNEAAGFTRRKQRPNRATPDQDRAASMRPPDLPGGNKLQGHRRARQGMSFNEAAGFTRRKPIKKWTQPPNWHELQ